MKTVLYMATSINGYIAKPDDDTSWISPEDGAGFIENSKKAGNMVLGKRTFEVCLKDGSFPFKDVLNVVMTREPVDNKWGDNVVFTSESPEEILKFLEKRGFETAFVAGGGTINSSFMREGLIDEIFLDIEPIAFGRGIPLFAPEDFECKLELLDMTKLNESTLHLHYKVIK